MAVEMSGSGIALKGATATTERTERSLVSTTADTTRRVLFGHLHTEDAASAVARRLRTAIGLGVLSDGEKLPKETDLAKQLGVTVFSLREALGILRNEGLIVTRVGKNGGSYVARPPAEESMAGDELVRLSASELRDLGDWRATLTTYASWLAAHRAAESTGIQLEWCADEMAAAGTAAQARRALGRFHVELSAGAQSMRLTRVELAVHEEFDWLVQTMLGDARQRSAVAEIMRSVAVSVRAGDASAAWSAGERMVSYLVTELMQTRLQLIAARHAGHAAATRDGGADLGAELRAVFGRTVRSLEEIAGELSVVFERSPTARDLNAQVARSVMPRLGELDEVVYGLGFMAEAGALPEARHWVEWWQRAADGAFDRDYSHQLDPARDDFYDYTVKGYMAQARETGAPSALGPYIDHGGTDDYVITVSAPVTAHGEFVGITAADVRLATLERSLSSWLAQADGVCVVLNSESRVLLSNSVGYTVGDVVPADGLALTDLGCFGWRLGRMDGLTPHSSGEKNLSSNLRLRNS